MRFRSCRGVADRSREGPEADFFLIFAWFLDVFLYHFLMIVLNIIFYMKIIDVLKVAVLPRREHHF